MKCVQCIEDPIMLFHKCILLNLSSFTCKLSFISLLVLVSPWIKADIYCNSLINLHNCLPSKQECVAMEALTGFSHPVVQYRKQHKLLTRSSLWHKCFSVQTKPSSVLLHQYPATRPCMIIQSLGDPVFGKELCKPDSPLNMDGMAYSLAKALF